MEFARKEFAREEFEREEFERGEFERKEFEREELRHASFKYFIASLHLSPDIGALSARQQYSKLFDNFPCFLCLLLVIALH